MTTCPAGHDSVADDYCDVCGLPISGSSEAPLPLHMSASALEESHEQVAPDSTCPNCGAASPPNALFCEACGYDFTTGATPRTGAHDILTDDTPDPVAEPDTLVEPAETPVAPKLDEAWVAEVWIDPDWYAEQESNDALPSAGLPTVVPLRTTSLLVGRASRSRSIHPDIDLSSDNGVSRRHCQLTTDGTRWWVEDLGSSNGTYVGKTVGAIPDKSVPAGEKREVAPDERIYLGAWSRIAIRRAEPGEA